jgi:hypothetical protein
MTSRVRRLLGTVLVTALLTALVPLDASAFFELDYDGHIKGDPDSFVGFNLKRTSTGKRRATFFTTRGIEFSCKGGSPGQTQFLTLDRSFLLKHRKFKGVVHTFTPAGDPVARVQGKLHRDRQVANGTIHLAGKLDPLQPSVRCDTGVQEWRVTRTG